jgi:hypothetical protein
MKGVVADRVVERMMAVVMAREGARMKAAMDQGVVEAKGMVEAREVVWMKGLVVALEVVAMKVLVMALGVVGMTLVMVDRQGVRVLD